jgi:hypothetical protein
VLAASSVACSGGDDGSSGNEEDVGGSDADAARADVVDARDTAPTADTRVDADAIADTRAEGSIDTSFDAIAESSCPSYSTSFDTDESPISEGGAWAHLGLDWALVDTAGGIAFGTQTGTGGYDDSYAHLSGFCADQRASAVIHRDATMDGSCTHEVEIHLRWSDDAHDAHGYEFNLAFDGSYAQIVRWNGPFGKFDYLGSGSVAGGVKEGDVIAASAIGDALTLTVNGATVATATDATWKTGNPGMGFWGGGPCGTRGDYGFTSYEASSSP